MEPPKVTSGKTGWGSRYWDCCKPHCSWREEVDTNANPFKICKNCNINDQEISAFVESPNADEWWHGYEGTKSGCDEGGVAYTCYDHAPYAVCEDLAYGFVAAPGSEAACGKCFLLEFDGGNKEGNIKDSHRMLAGKRMIVMASNIGHDVEVGQFDIMIPGGGLGAFAAGCKVQWGVDDTNEDLVGVRFGGLLSKCQQTHGWDDISALKTCVRGKCDALFGNKPDMKYLHDGCIWFVDWMHVADNPTYKYQEIDCPAELEQAYGSSRHPDKDSY
ncbi:MAG: hypothetical protein GX801_10605 [Fibrobacter sp.]|nr:hypothetical protein [Fibrobacter sp.]